MLLRGDFAYMGGALGRRDHMMMMMTMWLRCVAYSSFDHALTLPVTPYELGAEFIHTPECWLAGADDDVCRGPSLFRFEGSEPCAVVSGHCRAQFRMRPLARGVGGVVVVDMLTAREDECLLVLRKGGEELLLSTVNLSVRRSGAYGHALRVQGQTASCGGGDLAELWNQQLRVIVLGLILHNQVGPVVASLPTTKDAAPVVSLSRVGGPLAMVLGTGYEDVGLKAYRDVVFARRKASLL